MLPQGLRSGLAGQQAGDQHSGDVDGAWLGRHGGGRTGVRIEELFGLHEENVLASAYAQKSARSDWRGA